MNTIAILSIVGVLVGAGFMALVGSRSKWKDRAESRKRTLDGIAELDPAFAKVFGRRSINLRTADLEYRLDGAKIQRLAAISRRKNERAEDTTALKDALRELANERKVR